MTAKEIESALELYYRNEAYQISNVYFFHNETDFMAIRKSGLMIGCEIKTSVQDFKCDFKKPRHQHYLNRNVQEIENYFYYAVPENLITADMVPEYSGLLYVCEGGWVKEIKKAPKLHSSKHIFEKRLFNKMYYGYRESRTMKKDPEFQTYKKANLKLNKEIESVQKQQKEDNKYIRELISELRNLKKNPLQE